MNEWLSRGDELSAETETVMANRLQAIEIERFHRHLVRLGRTDSLEDSARLWISKYAQLWRIHYAAACVARVHC